VETLWFYLVAGMIAVYVVLDGFDLGAGALHLLVARTDSERRTVLQSIGPVWDGNEVWLLAGGGALVLAFPKLYASAFSGFYLPLMMVLWLLILRAISIEFRSHVDSPVWRPFWDAVFSLSSLLLAVFLGAALGNVVRGVPLGPEGFFFLPLWTSFRVNGEELGILDWFTLTVGVTSLLALTYHGATWLILRTEGSVRDRAGKIAGIIWPVLLALVVLVTILAFRVQPHLLERMRDHPAAWVLPILALTGLVTSRILSQRGREPWAFLASASFLGLMLVAVVFSLYPFVLPAAGEGAASLTVQNASGPPYSLRVALLWWVPGMALVTLYTTYMYRQMGGKVEVDPDAY
jgi:cytochrome d ubiquinol oxidase subunit II